MGVCRLGSGLGPAGLLQGLVERDLEDPSIPVGQVPHPLPSGKGDCESLEGGVLRVLGSHHPASDGHCARKTGPEPFVVRSFGIFCHVRHHAYERAQETEKVDKNPKIFGWGLSASETGIRRSQEARSHLLLEEMGVGDRLPRGPLRGWAEAPHSHALPTVIPLPLNGKDGDSGAYTPKSPICVCNPRAIAGNFINRH